MNFKIFNIDIRRRYPRYAVRKAKEIFGNKEVIVIEIGVYRGEHAISIIKELNVKKIYLIDLYKPYRQKDYDFEKDTNNSLGKNKEELIMARIKAHSLFDKLPNTKFIEEDSLEAITKIKEKVDFIYIDGNHDYLFVKRELEKYFPILNSGGIISGHDAHLIYVMKAVSEFAFKNNLHLSVRDSDWIIFKMKDNDK